MITTPRSHIAAVTGCRYCHSLLSSLQFTVGINFCHHKTKLHICTQVITISCSTNNKNERAWLIVTVDNTQRLELSVCCSSDLESSDVVIWHGRHERYSLCRLYQWTAWRISWWPRPLHSCRRRQGRSRHQCCHFQQYYRHRHTDAVSRSAILHTQTHTHVHIHCMLLSRPHHTTYS